MDSVLKLLAVFALVAINGIFVAAEFALVSVRPTRIEQLEAEGNRWARLVRWSSPASITSTSSWSMPTRKAR